MYASRKIIKAIYRTLKLNHGFFIILSMLKRIQSVEITLSLKNMCLPKCIAHSNTSGGRFLCREILGNGQWLKLSIKTLSIFALPDVIIDYFSNLTFYNARELKRCDCLLGQDATD